MRIWHQSITDLSELVGYAGHLSEIAGRIARPGTTLEVHGVQAGSYPAGLPPIKALRSPWAHHLLTTQVVMGAVRAREAGFDAVTISCFYDPGLEEAREASGLPVVSACETSVLEATAEGGQAGLLALDSEQQQYLTTLIDRHGLAQRVASIEVLEPAVTEHDLNGGLTDANLLRITSRAAERAVHAGATSVIPAEGVFNSRLASLQISQLAGVSVVDSFATLILRAQDLVTNGKFRSHYSDQSTFRRAAAEALFAQP